MPSGLRPRRRRADSVGGRSRSCSDCLRLSLPRRSSRRCCSRAETTRPPPVMSGARFPMPRASSAPLVGLGRLRTSRLATASWSPSDSTTPAATGTQRSGRRAMVAPGVVSATQGRSSVIRASRGWKGSPREGPASSRSARRSRGSSSMPPCGLLRTASAGAALTTSRPSLDRCAPRRAVTTRFPRPRA